MVNFMFVVQLIGLDPTRSESLKFPGRKRLWKRPPLSRKESWKELNDQSFMKWNDMQFQYLLGWRNGLIYYYVFTPFFLTPFHLTGNKPQVTRAKKFLSEFSKLKGNSDSRF